MKLIKLKLNNFRCISDLELDFKPITILTGSNSSGKSSTLLAIASMLHGSFPDSFPFTFFPNGDLCTLGSYRQIVSGQDITKNISIGVELYDESIVFDTEQYNLKINSEFSFWNKGNGFRLNKTSIKSNFGNLDITISENGRSYRGVLKINLDEKLINFYTDFTNIIAKSLKSEKAQDSKEPAIFTIKAYKKVEKQLNEFVISRNDRNLKKLVNKYTSHLRASLFFSIVKAALSTARDKSQYIAPARLYPDRIYLPKATASDKILPRGENIIELIDKWSDNKSKKLKSIIEFGNALGIFNKISAKKYKDGLLQLLVQTSNGAPLSSLQDVGFGVSQILPILAAEASLGKDSTLLLSQPELHLHPSAQADLSSLFIKNYRTNNRRYIIETHSEYMISRFRSLVVKGDVSNDDIIIYHFTMDNGKTKVFPININSNGDLINAPDDYFDTYRKDIFDILSGTEE